MGEARLRHGSKVFENGKALDKHDGLDLDDHTKAVVEETVVFSNADDGIDIDNVEEIVIASVNVFGNGDYGIQGDTATVPGTGFNGDFEDLTIPTTVTLTNVVLSLNGNDGIDVEHFQSTTFMDVAATHNGGHGIDMEEGEGGRLRILNVTTIVKADLKLKYCKRRSQVWCLRTTEGVALMLN